MTSAVIVGAGPNGLAAAAVLAKAGLDVTVFEASDTIGGGTRSSELIIPGLLHDHCSAFHPVAAASPVMAELDLANHGLRWLTPEIDCVHPLDDGSAGLLHRSIERTASGLGPDGNRWRRLFGPMVDRFDDLFADTGGPVLRIPRHPFASGPFGALILVPPTVLAKVWAAEQTRALWAGIAAHAFHRLDRPMVGAVGLMILLAGHREGWVVAEGGSRSITDAMASVVVEHGGSIELGQPVSSAGDLPPSDLLLLDVAPGSAADILGDRLSPKVARAYRRFRHGPGAFKVDFAIEGGVPWTNRDAGRAGTVHLGGGCDEMVASETEVHRGRMPDRPFVLVGQQYLADPGRSVGDVHPLWTYAHVPSGYTGDATEAITEQIERFAPGFRERVVGTAVRTTTDLSQQNPNFVGGDVIGGQSSPTQLVARPRLALDPYATGLPGTYLCSASTPPGAGAHGLGGANAAKRALKSLFASSH